MSTIVGDLARAQSAFDKPALALLHQTWAPVIVAVFTSQFGRETARIPADRFHVQVESCLDELRRRGIEVPAGTPREMCRRWVSQQWLSLTATEDGVEQYALTSHAQEAIEVVHRLAAERTVMFGESRIITILDAARRCATEANPDRAVRVQRLQEQIDRLTAERDRLAAGNEPLASSEDRVMEEYLNLEGLLAALPSDFIRVSETVKRLHREIAAQFRADERRSGEVLEDYLRQADEVMTGSLEGRAFTGAVQLLSDDTLLEELRADIDAILDHPFAQTLTGEERSALRRTVSSIHAGIETVIAERRRLSGTLKTHMARHDAVRDKELDQALRAVQAELGTWMQHTGPRTKAPLDLPLTQASVGHLRTKMYNPADHTPPPALERPEASVDAADFDAIRRQGGPTLAALRQALADRVAARGRTSTAEAFAALPPEMRRPVEVLGMIQSALTAEGVEHTRGEPARFDTVRPDGARRTFYAPQQVLVAADRLADPTRDPDDLTSAATETATPEPTKESA